MGRKAVALVSGGKDSIYAIHLAQQLGFSICAVATLLPRDNAVETDSYMYQSVGTSLGAAIAECLGVPHYSAHVKGRPVNTETLQYTPEYDDEVLDLQLLLERVTLAHPLIEAVTCGAILSEYQRRRLEYICGLAGLLPVCLLWNREQKSLLKNMIEWGLHAVVVKTASMGLSKKHLGRSIADLLPHFRELNRQYDFHVCGEGGEYETVTLDCPLFTRGSIVVSEWKQLCHSDDALAPVWLQSPVQWKVVPKNPVTSTLQDQSTQTSELKWLELAELRTKPYEDLMYVALNEWGVDVHDEDSDAASSPCRTGPDLRTALPSSCTSNKCCESTGNATTSSLGCIVTGDISVTGSEEGSRIHGDASSPPNKCMINLVRACTRSWLDEQALKIQHNGMAVRIIEVLCQASCASFADIPEEVLDQLHIRPIALTVVVTSLPRGVKLRFRIVLSSPEGLSIPPNLSIKSCTDDSVVHVHSVNLWVPPCAGEGTRPVHRLHVCCSCQGLRCELVSGGLFSVAYLFLRGCDGRLPFTCAFPPDDGLTAFPLRSVPGGISTRKGALSTVLQAANAFISMQYTRHLCYTGGANRGFHHNDRERLFIQRTEMSRAGSPETGAVESAALCASQMRNPPFMAPCIVVLVVIEEGREGTKTKSDKKLGVVKQLLHSLIARSSRCCDSSSSCDDTARQSILIVAEAPSLPQKARVLLLPMWDISPRLGERDCVQACCTEHMQQGEKYTVSVTVVERHIKVRNDTETTETTVAQGGGNGLHSMVVCFSFQRRPDYIGRHTLEDLVGQLCSTLTEWLCSAHARVALSSCGVTEDAILRGSELMLELCVFYCPSYLCLLQMDSESFEANCRQRIEAGCREIAASKFLPIITFFPVLNLEGGFCKSLCIP